MSKRKITELRIYDNAMIYDNFLSLHANQDYVTEYIHRTISYAMVNGQEKFVEDTKLWEGDIVQFDYDGEKKIGVITWEDFYKYDPRFIFLTIDGTYSNVGWILDNCHVILLGNIFDNPELNPLRGTNYDWCPPLRAKDNTEFCGGGLE